MVDKGDAWVCNKHQMPIFHRGPVCPWCAFIAEMQGLGVKEYKRGFEDGVRAMEAETKEATHARVVPE
jgi:hypothetical protein